jgi:hypothetical protein
MLFFAWVVVSRANLVSRSSFPWRDSLDVLGIADRVAVFTQTKNSHRRLRSLSCALLSRFSRGALARTEHPVRIFANRFDLVKGFH